jgi:hypothetical protein
MHRANTPAFGRSTQQVSARSPLCMRRACRASPRPSFLGGPAIAPARGLVRHPHSPNVTRFASKTHTDSLMLPAKDVSVQHDRGLIRRPCRRSTQRTQPRTKLRPGEKGTMAATWRRKGNEWSIRTRRADGPSRAMTKVGSSSICGRDRVRTPRRAAAPRWCQRSAWAWPRRRARRGGGPSGCLRQPQ